MSSSRLGGAPSRSARLRSYAAVAGQVLPAALVCAYLLLLRPRLFPAEGVAPMDFQCFWAASKVALTGTPAEAYDKEVLRAAQVALHGRVDAPD